MYVFPFTVTTSLFGLWFFIFDIIYLYILTLELTLELRFIKDYYMQKYVFAHHVIQTSLCILFQWILLKYHFYEIRGWFVLTLKLILIGRQLIFTVSSLYIILNFSLLFFASVPWGDRHSEFLKKSNCPGWGKFSRLWMILHIHVCVHKTKKCWNSVFSVSYILPMVRSAKR